MIEPIARIRIGLQDIEPTIWRRVDVPLSSTLMGLHDIVQVAMSWRDSHLFEFVVGEKVYAEPHPDDAACERKVLQAKGVRLKQLFDRGVERFLYVYDIGDSWRHDIVVEGVRDGDAEVGHPVFVDGDRRGPPEDVGGTSGFTEFLEAVLDRGHEEHARVLEWRGGPFDLDDIDDHRIRMAPSLFADRRRGPLTSHRRGGRAKPRPRQAWRDGIDAARPAIDISHAARAGT